MVGEMVDEMVGSNRMIEEKFDEVLILHRRE